ncbi:hypothetical protein F5882DRAFT_288764, partial [Hyaloscypha sp. PMI_1271]
SPLFLLPALVPAAPGPAFGVRSFGAIDPHDITIKAAKMSGNNSPQGTVATQFSDDRETVTFGFDNFQAFIGPSALQTDKTKQCQIHLNLNYPGRFISQSSKQLHGWARLDPGVNASFISTYFFSQAASKTSETRKYISGSDTSTDWSQGSTYEKVDTVKSASVIWSFCGVNGILNVNNRIGISTERGAPANAASELSDEDATVHFDQQVNLAWQPCDLK